MIGVVVHPADAATRGLADGDAVVVRSRRGRLSGEAAISDAVRRGNLFVPFVKLQDRRCELPDE